MTIFYKLELLEPEMENIRHKKNTCEEIYSPAKNGVGKCDFHLKKSNFKVHDTTKSVKPKICRIFFIDEKSILKCKKNFIFFLK